MRPHLVLLPGLGGTGAMFAPLIAEIGRRASIQIVSYPPDRFLTYPQLTDYVRAHLPADRPFVLVAESFSGPIALAIAAAPPPNLSALILCCTFARFPDGPLRWAGRLLPALPSLTPPVRLLAPVLMGRWATPELRHDLGQALSSVEPRVLRARALEALAVDARADVLRIRIPTLYLQAAYDHVVSSRAVDQILGLNSSVLSCRLRGPHFLLQCNPEGSWAKIAEFLESGVTPARDASPSPLPQSG